MPRCEGGRDPAAPAGGRHCTGREEQCPAVKGVETLQHQAGVYPNNEVKSNAPL